MVNFFLCCGFINNNSFNYKNMNWYREPDYLEHECLECGKPMLKDKMYCSDDCFQASQL